MKSFDTDLKKYADKVRLKVSERSALRERILSYIEYHPLPKQVATIASLPTMLESEPFTIMRVTRRTMQFAGAFLALIIVVLPLAAERSVPGEALYLIKTGINESVQAQLVNSPYEKIEFETKLMERRIAEARSLASQGKLTDDIKTQIAETVKGHTQSVTNEITELGAQDADGAAIARIAFNSSLEVQSAVLNADSGEDVTTPIGSILTAVNEARGEASIASEGEPAPSYEGLLARVELETTRAYELFETVKESATADEARSIERRLHDINRLIVESKDAHAQPASTMAMKATEDQFEDAMPASVAVEHIPEKLASTLGLIQKLIVFMTDIDVRETVTLDTLIPVVLSDAERATDVVNALSTHADAVVRINAALVEIEDAAIVEKISLGLTRIEELRVQAESALALDVPDVVAAETALTELAALVSDLDSLTAQPVEGESTEGTNPDVNGDQGATTTPDSSVENVGTGSSTIEVDLGVSLR